MMGASLKRGKEQSKEYQVKAVMDVIAHKKARDEDASFEENLLNSWRKYPGWGKVINACQPYVSNPNLRG